MQRNSSIDFVRGLVMLIMAIDHIRDLIHVTGMTQDPLNLATTTGPLFMTRWITHLCAPIFVFLSGVSVFLAFKKDQDLKKTQRFLWTRGIWLILLEYTIINFAIWFDPYYRTILSQVIAAIGFGFIILSFLIRWPSKSILISGLIILLGHNVLQNIAVPSQPWVQALWTIVYKNGIIPMGADRIFFINYPLIPWLGIMMTGFGIGYIFLFEQAKRKQWLLKIGLSALVFFVCFRTFNIYGDPSPWSPQSNMLFSVFSFINVTKYPPSMLYALITLGIMFLLLYIVDGNQNKFLDKIIVFGKVPLFYYILHWYLIHILMLLLMFIQGYSLQDLNFATFGFGRPTEGESGLNLLGVYVTWVIVILCLYPLCKWYGTYKATHPEKWWLRYL